MNFLKLTTKSLQNKLISKNISNFAESYVVTTCFIGAIGGMSAAVSSGIACDITKKVFPKDTTMSEIYKGFVIVPLFFTSIFGCGIIGCITGPVSVPLIFGYIPYKLYKK